MRERTLSFDLKRPCKDCPFRSDGQPYLTRGRAAEIAHALVAEQRTFSCHATNEWDEDDEGHAFVSKEPQHCAGAAIMLEKQERPNQWMRWMERIGFYDRTKLDMSSPVFATCDQFVEHHGGRRSKVKDHAGELCVQCSKRKPTFCRWSSYGKKRRITHEHLCGVCRGKITMPPQRIAKTIPVAECTGVEAVAHYYGVPVSSVNAESLVG